MVEPVSIALAGTAVSVLVKVILKQLTPAVSAPFSHIYGAESEFRKLKTTLTVIDGVLQDAEEKQYSNNSLRICLADIKDVVYDIDDLFDLISTQDLACKVNGNKPCQRLRGVFDLYSLAKQAKEIRIRLDEIVKHMRDFNLQVLDQRQPNSVNEKGKEETSSYIRESEVFGREKDKELIVNRVVSSKSGSSLVVPITGMGGIGKTTLAQLVYNDRRVEEGFNMRLWVYVSNKFVLQNVVGDIIQPLTGENCSNWSLEALQKRLHDILKDRTFLLVLDDVWNQNDLMQWDKLKNLLDVGSRSVIIVTTREESVASNTGTIGAFRIKELPQDHCWSIFAKCAFWEGEEVADPVLVGLGKSIIEKCKGVPLAVKTLGSLLRGNRDVDTWRKIEGSKVWRTYKDGILPALKLSYDHTPYHLRSCFAYCAIFGKGYPLHRHDLINVWMAQGLLQFQDREGVEDARDVGDEYFEDLLSRSFFQVPGLAVIEKYVMEAAGVFSWHPDWVNLAQSFKKKMIGDADTITKLFTDYRGKLPFVEMHDLMQELAVNVAGEEIFNNISSSNCQISERTRHLAWCKEDLSEKGFPEGLSKPSKARTFAFLHPMGSLSKSFLENLLLNFKCLRVLMLLESEFEELPDLIGDLKHLRYLDVSLNPILKQLPNAICKLVNLQVLDFGHCRNLEKLPKDMHRLVSLRTLVVTSKATCLPKRGFQCWTSLRILKIINCPNLTSLPENIGSLKSLKIFGVELCPVLASLPDAMKRLTKLEELSIGHCQQVDLAGWKGLLGLQNLEYLRLYGIPKLVNIPSGIESVAGSLQLLKVGDCEVLTSLPETLQHCTRLSKLQVFGCPKLPALPTSIQALTDLKELTIAGCSYLSERCERENGADWPVISHIPHIHIDHQTIQNNRLPLTQE